MAKNDPFQDENDPFAAARGRFGKPSTTFDKVIVDENKGKLLLLTPYEFKTKVSTRFDKPGDPDPGTDTVTADAVIFSDDGEEPEEFKGVMLFAKVIVGQLKSRVDTREPVLGILSQVPSSKGNPAWLLDPDQVTEAHVKQALAYLDAKEKEQVKEKGAALKAPKADASA